ncbi:hypothetical protein [Bacillus massiliigorillae]|uniref:hypothetical protein n=1 Tax=Bacillus massiliigorillae TaxID=1243664 RepID=UPI00039DE95D|nr:hypothetical protein [Bacillus massiliigorillae]
MMMQISAIVFVGIVFIFMLFQGEYLVAITLAIIAFVAIAYMDKQNKQKKGEADKRK